ncbi:type II toxin-antitoxin system VapB family antitoxin [Synechococcus sp. CS-1329]|uniref:type II toxin-antitoxin system VapB family antitoxin n=1 Tax=Synechococcus sp. CS-1329 TaxID=2847975 RepID=UPI00223BC422|nr:type II toxin-antitoxin system VapB family antitoxin [Synechococcus sp. CS-1329]MCT0218636.1 type II toxin-antitoxin system VapB family antitoxin [Synechococcus sp. CS-1329]
MRTTLNLDDDLLAQAGELSGIKERSRLIREALQALIERERSRRVVSMGSSEPQLGPAPRHRQPY